MAVPKLPRAKLWGEERHLQPGHELAVSIQKNASIVQHTAPASEPFGHLIPMEVVVVEHRN